MDSKQKYTNAIDLVHQDIHGYTILSSLNHSQYATCYLAETRDHSRLVMIERFPYTLSAEQEQQFLQQAACVQALQHPHILPMLGAGIRQWPYLIMDYVEHRTLRQIYAARSVYDLSRLLPYIKPLAQAVQYAHERRIAHKNVRPESVLLNRDNQVLLCDFLFDALNPPEERADADRMREAQERVVYMAPEQFVRQDSIASDIYALGVMVYEWIAGVPPFQGSYATVAEQHRQRSLPPLLQERQPVSPALVQTIQKAMAKDPAQRYATPLAFIEALELAEQEAKDVSYQLYVLTQKRQLLERHTLVSTETTMPLIALPETPPLSSQEAVARPLTQASLIPPTKPADIVPTSPLPVMRPVQRQEGSRSSSERRRLILPTRRTVLASLLGGAALASGGAWLLAPRVTSSRADPSLRHHSNSDADARSLSTTLVLFRGHSASVRALAWSPDNRLIATASDDHLVLVFDSMTGTVTRRYTGHSAQVNTVAWSPDGKWLASAGADNAVHIWAATTGRVLRIYLGHRASVNAVRWSARSTLIASASDDHTVQVWNVFNDGVSTIYQGHTDTVHTLAWSPDNSRIASGSQDRTVRVWAAVSSSALAIGDTAFTYHGHDADVYSVAWSPDGRLIASAGGDRLVQICRGQDGTQTGIAALRHAGPVYTVAWSPNGQQLATASADMTVRLWRSRDGEQLYSYREHRGSVYTVAWSHDGKRLASASADMTTRVWLDT